MTQFPSIQFYILLLDQRSAGVSTVSPMVAGWADEWIGAADTRLEGRQVSVILAAINEHSGIV